MTEQLLTSKSEHWCTPRSILDRVEQIDSIGLDPCTNPHSLVNAAATCDLSKEEDGLTTIWHGRGLVYINPPYGRKLPHWIKKIAAEALLGTEMVACLPARTDTKWFHEYVLPFATSILFVKGRIKFIDGTTGTTRYSATFPSMIVYYGQRKSAFKKAFQDMGFLIEP